MGFSHTELAWAAGFFDGEGSMSLIKQGGHRYPRLHLEQVDREVLDRFNNAIGNLGIVFGPYTRKDAPAHHKPHFKFAVQSWVKVQATIALIWSYLSSVKREQIRGVM